MNKELEINRYTGAVILKLLKYEGDYIEYGTIGYPEKNIIVQVEMKILSSINFFFTTNFTTNR